MLPPKQRYQSKTEMRREPPQTALILQHGHLEKQCNPPSSTQMSSKNALILRCEYCVKATLSSELNAEASAHYLLLKVDEVCRGDVSKAVKAQGMVKKNIMGITTASTSGSISWPIPAIGYESISESLQSSKRLLRLTL
jgi:hypothetical protein